MQLQLTITLQLVILSSWWFSVVQSKQEFLKKPPVFLKPCPLKDMTNNTCITSLVESIIHNFSDGIPDLITLSPLEPFYMSKLRIVQSVPPNVSLDIKMRNLTTYGLGQIKVTNGTTQQIADYYTLGLHIKIPKINSIAQYRLKGHALLLNLNSSGTFDDALDNLEIIVAVKMKPQLREGLTFMNFTAVMIKVVGIDKIQVHFTNLFNGNQELENSANELINSNWRILYELMRPGVTQIVDNVFQERIVKIFNFIPAKFLFEEFSKEEFIV